MKETLKFIGFCLACGVVGIFLLLLAIPVMDHQAEVIDTFWNERGVKKNCTPTVQQHQEQP